MVEKKILRPLKLSQMPKSKISVSIRRYGKRVELGDAIEV